MSVTFKITTPHNTGTEWHQWYFPGAYAGQPAIERRDARGFLQGKREGYFPAWLVLACNNTDCPGRAVVPMAMVLDRANASDPAVPR